MRLMLLNELGKRVYGCSVMECFEGFFDIFIGKDIKVFVDKVIKF